MPTTHRHHTAGPLSPRLRERLRALALALGEQRAAEQVGIAELTLVRACAGLAVRRITREQVARALGAPVAEAEAAA